MVLEEVLRDQRHVVSAGGKMFSISDFGTGPRIGDVEVGYVPVFNQAAKVRHDPELLKLTQSLDCQNAGVIELVFCPFLDRALRPVH